MTENTTGQTTGQTIGQTPGPTTEPTAPPPTPPRRLLRDREHGMVAGVASGIARYLGVDPVVVRLVFVLTVFAGGIGFVAYAAAWLLVPVGVGDAPEADRPSWAGDRSTQLLGGALVFVAALLIAGHWAWSGDIVVPVLFIAAGAWLLFRPNGVVGSTGEEPTSVDAPAAPAEPVTSTHAAAVPSARVGTPHLLPPPPPQPPRPPQPPHPPRPTGPPIARYTLALVLLVGGAFGLAAAAGADVSARAALTACLGLTGVGLVAGSVLGRARSLIPVGIVALFALSLVAVADFSLGGGVGERRYSPDALTDIRDTYRLGIGELVLDLRQMPAAELRSESIEIDASVGLGSLQILVPSDVTVRGDATAELGSVNVFGTPQEGVDPRLDINHRGTEGAGTITLDLDVGVGEVQVR